MVQCYTCLLVTRVTRYSVTCVCLLHVSSYSVTRHSVTRHVSAATITYTNLGADLLGLGDLDPGPPLAGQQQEGGGQLQRHTALHRHLQSGE